MGCTFGFRFVVVALCTVTGTVYTKQDRRVTAHRYWSVLFLVYKRDMHFILRDILFLGLLRITKGTPTNFIRHVMKLH